MEPIVPLISSSVSGPLAAKHLPRLWLKIVLHAVGRLPEGYRHGSGGLDEVTLTGLGIDAPTFIGYVESELPSYPQCEAWVRAHATNIGAAAIAEHNALVDGAVKSPEAAAGVPATSGRRGSDFRRRRRAQRPRRLVRRRTPRHPGRTLTGRLTARGTDRMFDWA